MLHIGILPSCEHSQSENAMQVLPHHLVSLIHYVELSKAGWLDEAVERYALAQMWLLKQPALAQQIRKGIEKNLKFDVKAQELSSALERLCKKGDVVALGDGRYKLSIEALTKLDKSVESANDLEKIVQEFYCCQVSAVCPDLNAHSVWSQFIDKFLIPFVMTEGAKTYEYFVGSKKISLRSSYADEFFAQIPLSCRELVQQVTFGFFNKNDPDISRFLLSYLDTYFLLAASGVSVKTLKKIEELGKGDLKYSIFVDTNFVYSILGLHDNPSNEAASDLMELITSASDHLQTHFFIIDRTVDETLQSIRYHKRRLLNVSYPPNVAEATLKAGVDISGVYRTFFERVSAAGRSISPEDYFEPYENGLIRVLESRGVTYLSTADSKKYDQTLEVIEDIENREKYERGRYGENAKPVVQITHDVVLWHFVRDQRGADIGSALQAKTWIVTVDFRFISFDRFKIGNNGKLPICMHPSQLIQMLRFFVPRSIQFENTLLAVMRLPLISREFGASTEQASIRIAGHLARYEGIEGISVDTLTAVLADKALCDRITKAGTEEEASIAIYDVLVLQMQAHEAKLRDQAKEIVDLREQIVKRDDDLVKLDETAHEQSTNAARTEAARAAAESTLDQTLRERDRYKMRFRILLGIILAGLAFIAILTLPELLQWKWFMAHPKKNALQFAAALFCLGTIWTVFDFDKNRRTIAFISVVVGVALAVIQVI